MKGSLRSFDSLSVLSVDTLWSPTFLQYSTAVLITFMRTIPTVDIHQVNIINVVYKTCLSAHSYLRLLNSGRNGSQKLVTI